MESSSDYKDPDYPGTSSQSPQTPAPTSSSENSSSTSSLQIEKIKRIIAREFSNELDEREKEMTMLDQRLVSARHLMARLRYSLVQKYYTQVRLKMNPSQIKDEIEAQVDPGGKAQVSSLLRENQKNIHPSLKKLLGKSPVDLNELFTTRAPRNKTRHNYKAMFKRKYDNRPSSSEPPPKRASTDSALDQPRKVPRAPCPKPANVHKVNEITRNQQRERYRIIIGNTSKYAPPASKADRSTHKWLLYVRGTTERADLSLILTGVTVTLHASYAPHHVVHIDKPPFHVSRRGWGEFPAKVELHFPRPSVNRPAAVEHVIKLDRNYTGLQTLGSETVIDVFLHSTEEMLPYVFNDDDSLPIPKEQKVEDPLKPIDLPLIEPDNDNSWLDFFEVNKPLNIDEMLVLKGIDTDQSIDTVLDDKLEKTLEDNLSNSLPKEIAPISPKKKIMKYVEPKSGKIYYFEMDKELDLSKVQEIIINPDDKDKGEKNEMQTQQHVKKTIKKVTTKYVSPKKDNGYDITVKSERKHKNSLSQPFNQSIKQSNQSNTDCISHIRNDHCYLSNDYFSNDCYINNDDFNGDDLYRHLVQSVKRFTCTRTAVYFLLKNVPLISDRVMNGNFVNVFPFVVENIQTFWSLDMVKRRNIEWTRAKFINKIVTKHLKTNDKTWRTKEILLFSRLYGFSVTKSNVYPCLMKELKKNNTQTLPWSELKETKRIREKLQYIYPNPQDINNLTMFNLSDFTSGDLSCKNESNVRGEEEIDILGKSPKKNNLVLPDEGNCDLVVLPADNVDKNRFLYIERKCAEIGIELRNEDIGYGYSYSAVHAVLLSAMKSYAEEIIRTSLAEKLLHNRGEALPIPIWSSDEEYSSTLNIKEVIEGVLNTRSLGITPQGLGVLPLNPSKL